MLLWLITSECHHVPDNILLCISGPVVISQFTTASHLYKLDMAIVETHAEIS